VGTEVAKIKTFGELQAALIARVPGANKALGREMLEPADIVLFIRSAERCDALISCSVPSIVGSLVEAKAMGWRVDGATGMAYLVPFGGKAVLIPGYRGLMDLIRRTGQCEPNMDAIHLGDTWEWSGDTFDKPLFRPSQDANRRSKPILGAFARVRFNDGSFKTIYWPYGQIIAHRNKFAKGYHKSDSPWNEKHPQHWVMCAKTVLIQGVRRGEFPVSAEDKRFIIRADDQSDERTILGTATRLVDEREEDATAARIDSHGANETVSEPDKAGLDLDAFRKALAECKTPADVRVCCMEAAKTCGNPDEDATVEKDGKQRLDELKGGGK
jgi:phage RecT family recombinase